ncbi:MAG: alpha/beta fold hydrolase [Isosphaeraceae bacterium]|nr:alpha/beta fold hydrolase [Isosphaeraceae bacterium]
MTKKAATKPGAAKKEAAAAEPTDAAPIAGDVETRPVSIMSNGVRMAGDLYLPKNRKPGERLPAIVLCAGTGGTKKGLPTRLGPILARNGFIVLGFDYRGWGESDSEILVTEKVGEADDKGVVTIKGKPIRWQMNLMDQTFDIRCAIAFLAGEPSVDPDRIGLFGSSYGGGLVTLMAAIDPRVKCAAAQVSGLGVGPQADRAGYALLTRQARGEVEPVPFETGKLGGKMERYVNMRRNPARNVGFGEKFDLVGRIRVPMIFVDAENEELSNPKENGEKFAAILKANGVPVEYHVIKGITHYGIYREGFEEATKLEPAFFTKHLRGEPKPAAEQEGAKPKAEMPKAKADASKSKGATGPAEPETAFRYLDADGDDRLTEAEVGKLRESVAFFKNNPEAIATFFKRLDADSNGSLTLEEYRKVSALQRRPAGDEGPRPTPPARTESPRPAAPGSSAPEPKPTSEPRPAPKSTALGGPATEAARLAHFEKKIRPVLVAECYSCHSSEAAKLKGGLALDTREGILRGGDSGPAIVPGDPAGSLLLAALRHEDGLEMPPKKKLSDDQIADFTAWVTSGAIDPRDGGSTAAASTVDIEKGRDYWAFQPVVAPSVPKVADASWTLAEIDRFVRAEQELQGLSVVGDASPEILIRRLSFDLIGLPPTPDEIRAFEQAWKQDADRALESTVDRLLDSPRFGERWGRHWLDVARFAESSGKETSFSYPQAWRYRDHVIAAFNADMPINRFIREQIAGDLLPAENEADRAAKIVATGFLALGPKSHIERNKKQFEMDLVDEQIDATTQAFLGLTVACARCHDHKFDPIPQTDYYALAGIFRSTETLYGTIPVIQNNNPSKLIDLSADSGMPAGVAPPAAAERERLTKQIADLRAKRGEMARRKQFASSEYVQSGILLNTLLGRVEAYGADGTPKSRAMGVRDRATAKDSELFLRGEVEKPGAVVPRGFVQVVGRSSVPKIERGSGRRELADWIASAENPLTARVFVNRVWLQLFGRGLVETPDNFGASGRRPSHPQLLDHLAAGFTADGWSLKRLIKRIVLSRVYRLDSQFVAANHEKDPENVRLWRMAPRRSTPRRFATRC